MSGKTNVQKKECRECKRALSHTRIEARWKLVSIEGEVKLGVFYYCVSCGTLKKDYNADDID